MSSTNQACFHSHTRVAQKLHNSNSKLGELSIVNVLCVINECCQDIAVQ